MLLGVAVAAAKMLGVLPGVDAPPVVGVPTVLTDRLPGGGFLTGTTTLLLQMRHVGVVSQCLRTEFTVKWSSGSTSVAISHPEVVCEEEYLQCQASISHLSCVIKKSCKQLLFQVRIEMSVYNK